LEKPCQEKNGKNQLLGTEQREFERERSELTEYIIKMQDLEKLILIIKNLLIRID
jgi:hypothetical protein